MAVLSTSQTTSLIRQIYANKGMQPPTGAKLRLMASKAASNPAYLQTIARNPQNYIGDLGTVNYGKTPTTTGGATTTTPPDPGPAPGMDARSIDLAMSSIGLPPELASIYREEFLRSGRHDLALAAVRQSPRYDSYFPGNRREDGTVRYLEGEYRSVVDAYADSLSDFGVNADIFADHFGRLIAGDVSAQEFRGRVTALYDTIGLRLGDETSGDAWRQEFAQEFGVDPSKVTLSTVLGVALDPQIGNEVLERRMSIVQVTANATRFGFSRSRVRAEALLNAGLQGQQAQQFYGQAAAQLPRLSGMAGRFNEGEFGIGEFEEAFALGDVEDQRRVERLQRREASLFSQGAQARQDQGGDLTGLRSV